MTGASSGHLGERRAHRLGARLAAGDAGGDLAAAELLGEQDRRLLPAGGAAMTIASIQLGRLEPLEALGEQRQPAQLGERLRPVQAEPLAASRGGENGPDVRLTTNVWQPLRPARRRALTRRFFAVRPTSARTSSSQSLVSSSSMPFAYISSLARIFLALTNICFSPVERPFSWSRSERFRTTSASSKMSPVFILSRLCLKRRFQFFGISVPLPVSALSTLLDRLLVDHLPQADLLGVLVGHVDGHVVVKDLDRQVLALLAEHLADSFFTTVPAP